ncbi:MAG: cytochrome c oxidase assembly protein [Proteobacteria bacterium]|nr:cytochrome c oxidase assembly protein [Pseudomonadota bacterium]
MSTAYAHNLYDPLPPETFDLKWAWDPALIFFVVLAILYYRGLKAFRGKLPVKKWQIFLFYLGLFCVIAAMVPPIDPLSDQLFFVHMIQHLLITNIGVPLMMLGVPFFICVRGLSPGIRRNVFFPIVKNRLLRLLFRFIAHPLVSLGLFQAAYWFWHVPYFYNLALLHDGWHLVEHASFAWVSILLWRNIIAPHPMRSPLKLPVRMLYVMGLMASNVILSAFLSFSDTVWYAYAGRPIPEWWKPWDHLDDQRLGGLLMWVPGEFIDFFVVSVIFVVWTSKVRRDEELQRKNAAVDQVDSHA